MKYLVALCGLPGTDKKFLGKILSGFSQVSVYSWGKIAAALVTDRYGQCGFSEVVKFTTEIEPTQPLIVAEAFLSHSEVVTDSSPVVVIDGIKSPAQLRFLANALDRHPFVVRTEMDESKRLQQVAERAEFDDLSDEARLHILQFMGLYDLMDLADVTVHTTGTVTQYRDGVCHATICEGLLNDFQELFHRLNLLYTFHETKQFLQQRITDLALVKGFRACVEFVD